MKSIGTLNILFFTLTFLSCRKATVTEVKPFQASSADTTKVLLVESSYPCMKLVTEDVVPLIVGEAAANPLVTAPEGNAQQENSLKTTIHYLPLETTEECLIGNIDKLESDDCYIFIFDRENGAVFRFSQKDGSFQNKYSRQGRGPGEYTRLTDMSIDKKRKEICLLDQFGFKIMYFDYNGNLLREEPLFYVYDFIEFLGDHIILNTNLNENEMVPAVNNNRLVYAKRDQTPVYVSFAYSAEHTKQFHKDVRRAFTTCNGEVYYNHVLSDTIWQITEDGSCIAKYVFKFPNRNNLFDEKDCRQITDNEYEERTKDIPYFGGNTWLLTTNFICAKIVHGGPMLYCIPTGRYVYGYPKYRSFGLETKFPVTHTLNDTSFVRVIQPFQLIQQHKNWIEGMDDFTDSNYWKNLLTEEERQLLSNMTEEDNPILMIMDIEPF